MTAIYSEIYTKLARLGVLRHLEVNDYGKSQSEGFMDLSLDLMDKTDAQITIALAHYYRQNSDLCADPDMQIRIYTDLKQAEALTFQMAIPPIYQEVYPAPGQVNIKLKAKLNRFLHKWLSNAIDQGHRFR